MRRARRRSPRLAVLDRRRRLGCARRATTRFARNVLPPGQDAYTPDLDQMKLYDGLTPLGGDVTTRDLTRYYKPETSGSAGEGTVDEKPKRGVTILRDRWDVPHVYGKTRAATEFGAGWATAEDRGSTCSSCGPGAHLGPRRPRSRCVLARSGAARSCRARRRRRSSRSRRPRTRGRPRGRQLVRDVEAYVAGINAYSSAPAASDAVHDERRDRDRDVDRRRLRQGRRRRGPELGVPLRARDAPRAAKGLQVWNDLREHWTPRRPSRSRGVPVRQPPASSARATSRSTTAASSPGRRRRCRRGAPLHMSNALLVGAKRSTNGHPLFVAGPQVGYYCPRS